MEEEGLSVEERSADCHPGFRLVTERGNLYDRSITMLVCCRSLHRSHSIRARTTN